MVTFFNREFNHIDKEGLQELNTLEIEGSLYNYLWSDTSEEFVYTRIQLTPVEIVEYVDAMTAYEEFLAAYNRYGDPTLVLDTISNASVRRRVESYNSWATGVGQEETTFCPAAFLGEHLEDLICAIVPGRHEILTKTYSGDRRFLLREILEMFPESVGYLSKRQKRRPPYKVEQEQDVHDLPFSIVKCVFPDARPEESTMKHAGGSKRIDIVFPSISTVVEIKYVRDGKHAGQVADELKIDFESYHVHPDCKTLIAYVWDPMRGLSDRYNFIKDLRGLRVKGENRFNVEVVVKP